MCFFGFGKIEVEPLFLVVASPQLHPGPSVFTSITLFAFSLPKFGVCFLSSCLEIKICKNLVTLVWESVIFM